MPLPSFHLSASANQFRCRLFPSRSPIAMADELPIEKISISGPILASLLQRFASSPGDVDGLLFGHFTRLPPPDLRDDDPATYANGPATSPLAIAVTAHFCSGAPMTFYDSLGRVDRRSLRRAAARSGDPGAPLLIGWFSGRRRTPLRPSMREHAVSLSLARILTLENPDLSLSPGSFDLPVRPCVFLLLSSSSTPNQALHTHDYRAFVLTAAGGSLEPRSLDVVNVGPAFRGQYNSFSPESALPLVPCLMGGLEHGKREGEGHSVEREKQLLDSMVEGFGLERLKQLAGPGAVAYTTELEDLYEKMLLKLRSLAKLVEKNSSRVLEQENRNLMLRSKLAGLE